MRTRILHNGYVIKGRTLSLVDPKEPLTKMSNTELDNDKQLATFSLTDWVPKLFGVTVASVYLVGFLVVVRYLSGYGVSSLEVFQLQYLVAGAWVVVPIAALALMKIASGQFESHAFSQGWEGKAMSWRRRLAVSSVSSIPFSFVWGRVYRIRRLGRPVYSYRRFLRALLRSVDFCW